MQYDPRELETLKGIQASCKGADLQQFVSAMNWIKSAIPDFAAEIAPLHSQLRNSRS